MANKDRNKRSARKARAEERARVEAAQAASKPADPKVAKKQEASAEKAAKAMAKQERKAEKAEKAEKKPGLFRRLGNYLSEVRSEMRRVVWPSKEELKSYSVAIVAMLIVFGIVIWLVDTGVVAALVGYTGLRG